MASSKLDPLVPWEFENGVEAWPIAEVWPTGKMRYFDGRPSVHADGFAEIAEQGVRYIVAADPKAKVGGCITATGVSIEPWGNQFFAAVRNVRHRDLTLDTDGMDAMPEWGSFA